MLERAVAITREKGFMEPSFAGPLEILVEVSTHVTNHCHTVTTKRKAAGIQNPKSWVNIFSS